MRKTSAVLASLSLVVLALTGCAATPTYAGAPCDRTDDANGIQNAVTVKGEVGAAPEVNVFAPLHLKQTSFTDLAVGTGRPVVNANQILKLEMSLYSGNTGEKITSTRYDSATTGLSTVNDWTKQAPGLGKVLECATAGSRIIAALTPEDMGAASLQSLQLEPDDNVIFVFDVVDVFLSKAEGTAQFNDSNRMPSVVRAPDGTPGVIIPDTAAPKKQVVQTLIKGDGDAVTAKNVPIVNVTSLTWDDKTVSNTTWGQAASIDLQKTAPEVAKALIGKPVGSQVLVVTPATGENKAMVYVVDILAAVTVPEQ